MDKTTIDLSKRLAEYAKQAQYHREMAISFQSKIEELQELVRLSLEQKEGGLVETNPPEKVLNATPVQKDTSSLSSRLVGCQR